MGVSRTVFTLTHKARK